MLENHIYEVKSVCNILTETDIQKCKDNSLLVINFTEYAEIQTILANYDKHQNKLNKDGLIIKINEEYDYKTLDPRSRNNKPV